MPSHHAPVRLPLSRLRADMLGTQRALLREHGSVIRYQARGRVFALVADAQAVHEVLVARSGSYRRGLQARNLSLLIGRGLATTEGERWQRQRKRVQPAFNRALLARVAEITAGLASETADGWLAAADAGETVDVFAAMQRLAARVISRALFSQDMTEVEADLNQALSTGLRIIARGNVSRLAPPAWLPTRSHRMFRRHQAAVRRFVDARVDERLADPGRHRDILGDLVRAYSGDATRSRRELRDQAFTLFYAGFETTAAALTWTWLLLSQNPEAEARFHAELDRVLPGGRVPALEDLSALPYTSQVIQESMRMYPPVYTIARVAAADGGPGRCPLHLVRRGDSVVVPAHALHRMAEYWPDPDSFRPERFAPGRLTETQRKAYVPFNAGPHRCLGASFATTEMATALVVIGRRLRLRHQAGEPVTVQVAITQRPANGLWMHVETRAVPAAAETGGHQ